MCQYLEDVFARFPTPHVLIVGTRPQRDVQVLKDDVRCESLWIGLVPGLRGEIFLLVPVELEILAGRCIQLVTVSIKEDGRFSWALYVNAVLFVFTAHVQCKTLKVLEVTLVALPVVAVDHVARLITVDHAVRTVVSPVNRCI